MRSTILVFAILLSFTSLSAQNIDDVFSSSKTKMVFVGLDFSKAKMVGSKDFCAPDKIKDRYFGEWNELMVSEMDKFDLKKAFMKEEMDYDLSIVEKGNNDVDVRGLVINNTAETLSEKTIKSMVKAYDTEKLKAPFGIAFIVHAFSNFEKEAIIEVVIFSTKSKKVLFSRKMSGSVSGFGYRNYWGGAIHDIIRHIERREFKLWKKEMKKIEIK